MADSRNSLGKRWALAGALIALSIGSVWYRWREINSTSVVPSNGTSSSVGESSGASKDDAPTGPIVDRMTDRPAKFIGTQVTIEGNVHSVPATRVFSIVEPGSRNPLLVIATQSPPPLRPDDEIEARGKIAKLDPAAMQRQYGVDLTPERIGNWAGKPVLIAERVLLHHSARAR